MRQKTAVDFSVTREVISGMRELGILQLASALFIFLPAAFVWGEYQDGVLIWTRPLFIAMAICLAMALAYTALFMWLVARRKNNAVIYTHKSFVKTFYLTQVVLQMVRGITRGVAFSDLLLAVLLLSVVQVLIGWMRQIDNESAVADAS